MDFYQQKFLIVLLSNLKKSKPFVATIEKGLYVKENISIKIYLGTANIILMSASFLGSFGGKSSSK